MVSALHAFACVHVACANRNMRAHAHQAAFVPDGAGALRPPGALHDPRRAELLALLDPEAAFPSADICADGGALAALQRLGLREAAGARAFGACLKAMAPAAVACARSARRASFLLGAGLTPTLAPSHAARPSGARGRGVLH